MSSFHPLPTQQASLRRRFSGMCSGLALAGVLLGSVLLCRAAPPAPTAAARPLDRALGLIAAARKSFQKVQDYSCTLVKREVMNGQLQVEQVIALKARTQPFSIDMQWQKPKTQEGQEVCYVAGQNNGMMRVKGPGLLGAVGFINLDPHDPRAMQHSKHCVTEAGIGNLIERFAARWESERSSTHTQMRINEYEFNKRKCVRVETSHPDTQPGEFYAYRTVVYFDKEHHLPIRTESYDWPKEGGKADGELRESFSFIDLQLNPKLEDSVFKR